MSTTLSARASLTTSTFRSQSLVTSSKSSSFSSTSVSRRAFVVTNAATISFVRDTVETSVPDVKLTKSRDGTSGTAFFTFENPDVFESASGDITGMYLTDEEGEMTTVCFSFLFYISSRKNHIKRLIGLHSSFFNNKQTNKQTGRREREIREREAEVHRSAIHHAQFERMGKIYALHDAIRGR